MSNETFSLAQLEAIAGALGDTDQGLTGTEIDLLLANARIEDVDPGRTKRTRLLNAFVTWQNRAGHRRNILAFIRFSMKPERYVRTPERYEPMRANLNRGLAFSGLQVRNFTRQQRTTTRTDLPTIRPCKRYTRAHRQDH